MADDQSPTVAPETSGNETAENADEKTTPTPAVAAAPTLEIAYPNALLTALLNFALLLALFLVALDIVSPAVCRQICP